MSRRDEERPLPEGPQEPDTVEPANGTVLDFLWQDDSICGPHEAVRQEPADADGDLGEALARYASWLTAWGEE